MSVRWNPCPARGRIWEQSVERDKLGCHRWMKTNNWTNWEETSNRWARTRGSKCVQGSLNSNLCSYSDPLTHLQSESVWCRPRSLRPPRAWGAGLGVWLSQLNTRSLQEKKYINSILFNFSIACRMRHSRGWCERGRWGRWLRLSCSCSGPRAPGDPWPPHPPEAGLGSVESWNTGHSRACHSGPGSSVALTPGIKSGSEGFSLMLQFLASFPDQDWNNDDDEWI